MKRLARIVPIALAFSAPAQAQDSAAVLASGNSEETVLERRAAQAVEVMLGQREAEGVFAPTFLAQVPAAQLQLLAAQLAAEHGALSGVESVTATGANTARIRLRFADAIGNGTLTLAGESPFPIVGLFISDFAPLNDSADAIASDLADLNGTVTALYTPLDGEPIFGMDEARPLAVGSSVKLTLLAALAQDVADGKRAWDDIVRLPGGSFSGGTLQSFPDGAPVTLHTIAALMISESDNTATDLVAKILGQDAIAAEFARAGHADPAANRPFVDTQRLFLIKATPDRIARWTEGTEAQRKALLAELADVPSEDLSYNGQPTAIDTVEWFYSPRDIVGQMRRLATMSDPTAREIMAINAGMPAAEAGKFDYVGYKGGSEPGVVSLNWLVRKGDQWRVLSITQNDTQATVDTAALVNLGLRILRLDN